MKGNSKYISFCKASVILLSLMVPVMSCAASQTSTNQAAFDTSVYDDVLNDYRAIYSDDVITEDMVSMNVNVGNGWVRYKSPDLQYAYVDLAQNGKPALVISAPDSNSDVGYDIVDVRLFLDGQVVPDLRDEEAYNQPAIELIPGDRYNTYLLTNGYVYSWGSGGADVIGFEFYQIGDDGPEEVDGFSANWGEYLKYEDGAMVPATIDEGRQILEKYGLSSETEPDAGYDDYIGNDVVGQCRTDIEWMPILQQNEDQVEPESTTQSVPENLSDASTDSFYGVWCYASRSTEDAVEHGSTLYDSLGIYPTVVLSSQWSNLNSDPWYCLSAGKYSTQEEAESVLTQVRSVYSDAYVKYSGNFMG